jgi:hypothetical protein
MPLPASARLLLLWFMTHTDAAVADMKSSAADSAAIPSAASTSAAAAAGNAASEEDEEEGEWEGNPSFVQTASGTKVTADAESEGESESAAAAVSVAAAAAEADDESDSEDESDASASSLMEASAAAGATWAPGSRDDVTGGKGSFKFVPVKGKGCWIEQNTCPRWNGIPRVRPFADGYFHRAMGYGWYGPWKTEKACLSRAKQFHDYCNGGETSSSRAVWRPTGRSAAWPAGGCWIRQSSCAKYPAYKGFFYDTFDNVRSAINQDRCFKRAKEYHTWCDNPKSVTTTAEYRPTGRVKSYPEGTSALVFVCAPGLSVGTPPVC